MRVRLFLLFGLASPLWGLEVAVREAINPGLGRPPAEVVRSTPAASFRGLLSACAAEDFRRAAHFLDLSEIPKEQQAILGPEVAEKLCRVLSRLSARAQAVHIGARPEDVVIGSLPLNHVGGITCGVATMLVAGGSVALVPYFRPDLVVEAVRRHRVTIFAGVPTMYHMVFGYPGFSPADFSSVRLCIVGGSSVEPRLATQIANTFPWAQLINLYGLSESSGACIMSPLGEPVDKVATSIGVPIGDFRVKVVDNERRDVPAGETGELVIYGDCVAKGYYGLPEATRETFGADGALYTGDMGYLEPDGHVVLRGRKKEMYVQGGFNVYPVEIENLLMKHPKVAMVAGIGVPDPVFGEVGRFYVVPRPGAQLTAEELLAYCRENLADYKVPRQFVFVDELPLTPAGKIHKALLRQWYEEGRL